MGWRREGKVGRAVRILRAMKLLHPIRVQGWIRSITHF